MEDISLRSENKDSTEESPKKRLNRRETKKETLRALTCLRHRCAEQLRVLVDARPHQLVTLMDIVVVVEEVGTKHRRRHNRNDIRDHRGGVGEDDTETNGLSSGLGVATEGGGAGGGTQSETTQKTRTSRASLAGTPVHATASHSS